MPQLFSLVKNYETNFEDNTLRWVYLQRIPKDYINTLIIIIYKYLDW